jgi:hypothetical protein
MHRDGTVNNRAASNAGTHQRKRTKAAANLLPGSRRPRRPRSIACRVSQTSLYVAAPARGALRLAVQDAALSRRKHGFDSRRARQQNQGLRGNLKPAISKISRIFGDAFFWSFANMTRKTLIVCATLGAVITEHRSAVTAPPHRRV